MSDDEIPAIRAARQSDPAELRAMLEYYTTELPHVAHLRPHDRGGLQYCSPNAESSGAIDGTFESPLTAALRARQPTNVRLLLDAGADPTGISRFYLSDYAARFVRGRDAKTDMSSFAFEKPRQDILAVAESKGIRSETQPLTHAELDERRGSFPRFWTEPNLPGQRLRMDRALTALEVAAGLGDEEMFEEIRAAGGDETAWVLRDDESNAMSERRSFLSVSSPIHEAIEHGQPAMLNKLLHKYNYCPNYRPLAAPTIALPPLSFAIARCDPHDANVRACISHLLAHPALDPHARTPIFDVHVLHFAAARHDPALLRWLACELSIPLPAAGTTALGHTLLHIACLPLTSKNIDQDNAVVAKSIHCARTLDDKWLPHPMPSPLHITAPRPVSRLNPAPRTQKIPMTAEEQQAQIETIRCILDDSVGIDVRAQDVDGNTAMHYLAATLGADPRAMQMLRAMDGGEEVYRGCLNREGVAPWELEER